MFSVTFTKHSFAKNRLRAKMYFFIKLTCKKNVSNTSHSVIDRMQYTGETATNMYLTFLISKLELELPINIPITEICNIIEFAYDTAALHLPMEQ